MKCVHFRVAFCFRHQVCLDRYGDRLCLSVPGVSEGQPSVLVGDSVILSDVSMPENAPQYQGYVHEVQKEGVLLGFQQQFHDTYDGQDFNVRFVPSR